MDVFYIKQNILTSIMCDEWEESNDKSWGPYIPNSQNSMQKSVANWHATSPTSPTKSAQISGKRLALTPS